VRGPLNCVARWDPFSLKSDPSQTRCATHRLSGSSARYFPLLRTVAIWLAWLRNTVTYSPSLPTLFTRPFWPPLCLCSFVSLLLGFCPSCSVERCSPLRRNTTMCRLEHSNQGRRPEARSGGVRFQYDLLADRLAQNPLVPPDLYALYLIWKRLS
jgi:hypothetical protein